MDSARLSCFCTQRKSTDIIPPKTDWLTFEFWFWLLLITLYKSCSFHVRRYQRQDHRRRVVDWDRTGTTTDLQNLTLGLNQRGASVKHNKVAFSWRIFNFCSVWIKTACTQMKLRGNHRVEWREDVLNQRRDNQQCCREFYSESRRDHHSVSRGLGDMEKIKYHNIFDQILWHYSCWPLVLLQNIYTIRFFKNIHQ